MGDFNIYKDIAERTQGDIYLGVVGPVRTGKSTFIKKFMDLMVIPKIENTYKKERAKDELPQSGSGKTTLCNLLPRFYEVSSGEITIDGRNIQQMTLASLRKQIGIVQQDVFLFPGTLRENIAYGNLNATEMDIQQAVKLAHLEHVIQLMPDGLDTIIGERGVKLSGGQKQRVAIARMFLKNPPILILDEATSALDTETE